MADDLEAAQEKKKLLELDDEAESNLARQILEKRAVENEKSVLRSGESNLMNVFIILLIVAGIIVAGILVYMISQDWEIVIPKF